MNDTGRTYSTIAARLSAAIGIASNGGKVEALPLLHTLAEVTGTNPVELIRTAASANRVYRESNPEPIPDTEREERISDHVRY